jgi:hypothetical protein
LQFSIAKSNVTDNISDEIIGEVKVKNISVRGRGSP